MVLGGVKPKQYYTCAVCSKRGPSARLDAGANAKPRPQVAAKRRQQSCSLAPESDREFEFAQPKGRFADMPTSAATRSAAARSAQLGAMKASNAADLCAQIAKHRRSDGQPTKQPLQVAQMMLPVKCSEAFA